MNCDDIATLLRGLTEGYGWQCRPLPGRDDVVELSTGRRFLDGEPIRLTLRLDADETIVASDGGRSFARLRESGFDDDDDLLVMLWEQALRAYRVSELDDRVYVQAPMARAAEAVARLADTVVALDGLQVVGLPTQVKGRSLADEVEGYLQNRPGVLSVSKSPEVRIEPGLIVRPSMSVTTEARGRVLVQAGAATSKTQAFDHAFSTFVLLGRADVRMESRLTILGGQPTSWNEGRVQALAEVSYVGFWGPRSHRAEVLNFLQGEDRGGERVLVPSGVLPFGEG